MVIINEVVQSTVLRWHTDCVNWFTLYNKRAGNHAWYMPVMIHGFAAPPAFSIAQPNFGRRQLLWEPLPFWIGMVFGAFAVLPRSLLARPSARRAGSYYPTHQYHWLVLASQVQHPGHLS